MVTLENDLLRFLPKACKKEICMQILKHHWLSTSCPSKLTPLIRIKYLFNTWKLKDTLTLIYNEKMFCSKKKFAGNVSVVYYSVVFYCWVQVTLVVVSGGQASIGDLHMKIFNRFLCSTR